MSSARTFPLVNYSDALFDAVMYPLEAVTLAARRRARVPRASGDVLEVGAGTGANLEHYNPARVASLTLTDLEITAALRNRAASLSDSIRVSLKKADAQSLPFPDAAFDTVLFTLVFCSVPDQRRGLAEVRRVLRPGGRIVFIEHVRPPRALGRLTDLANPLWHAATGECNINRDTAAAINRAGFRITELRDGGGGFLIDGIAERAG